ncbi:tripartite motif-containing protein 54-like [Erpetoichthys calabaricus]|nr:tripartite motif-containing protein 54-like [Erpetoichthys calabaricus]
MLGVDHQTGRTPTAAGPHLESLERQLSCPICLELFSKPVLILPCQHNLCRGCASRLYETHNPYHYTGGVFRCPTCRYEVYLDRHGVGGLRRNLLVENIVDICREQQARDSSKCASTSGDGGEPLCAEHEEETLNVYCRTCQVPTCSLCKVFGAHKNCEVCLLSDVYLSRKGELARAVDALGARRDGARAAVEELEGLAKRVAEGGRRQRDTLTERFEALCGVLHEKRAALLLEVAQEEEAQLETVRGLIERHQGAQRDIAALLQTALLAVEEQPPAATAASFLLTSGELLARIRTAAQRVPLPVPKSDREGKEHLHCAVGTEQAEAALRSLDFDGERFEDAAQELRDVEG